MWRRRVTGETRSLSPQPIVNQTILKRRFKQGYEMAEATALWILKYRGDDPLQILFRGTRFPRTVERMIYQAALLFGVIHGARDFQSHAGLVTWERNFLDTYLVRRAHVAIQQLLTLSWLKLEPTQRRTVVHFWADNPKKSALYEEWRKNCTGVNKAAIVARSFEMMRGGWRVYLAAITMDQFDGIDLIATGRGKPRRSARVTPMGCLVQAKSGDVDSVTVVDETRIHYKDVGEKERVRITRALDIADGFSFPTRRFVPVHAIVGKTPDGVHVYDVEARASLLVAELENALR